MHAGLQGVWRVVRRAAWCGVQRARHVLDVISGLAHAHEHNVTQGRHAVLPHSGAGSVQLQQDLIGGEGAQQPHRARRAEGAALPAAHLGRHAERREAAVRYDHSLDLVATWQAEQQLAGAALGD